MASVTGPKSNWVSATTVQPSEGGYPTGKTPAAERNMPVEGGKIPANTNIVR
jgi:hypothetical protein